MPDVTLVVMYNNPVPASVVQIVQRMYQPVFSKVIPRTPKIILLTPSLITGTTSNPFRLHYENQGLIFYRTPDDETLSEKNHF
jgi:hypothetical protein